MNDELTDEEIKTVTEYADNYASNFKSSSQAYIYFYNTMLASKNEHQTEF